MVFAWLKRFVPRSLYARAALILLVPVLTIQVVVTIVFVQRLYEDVTAQMTESALLEIEYLRDLVESAPDLQTARSRIAEFAAPFEMVVRIPAPPRDGDRRLWYDWSGRVVTADLRAAVPAIAAVDLAESIRRVALTMDTRFGPMDVVMPRGRVSASNPHQLLVLMALTSILMTIVAFVYMRNQLRPVKRLARAAEAFGRGRVVDFVPRGATEMRAAGQAFLDMRTRLERMIDQRTLMLSGVSHDLRTPLTRLKLGLSLLDETPETVAMQRDVKDMEQLLETFLDFARTDALDDRTMVDPVAVVKDVLDRWRSSGRQIELAVASSPVPMVNASPMALSRALENLFGNAARYGTRARITVAACGRSVMLSVEDDGPGILAHERAEALRPFARLDHARNQDRGPGVGLGLAIAHDIARRHGGTLTLGDSASLGGLRVDIVLPV